MFTRDRESRTRTNSIIAHDIPILSTFVMIVNFSLIRKINVTLRHSRRSFQFFNKISDRLLFFSPRRDKGRTSGQFVSRYIPRFTFSISVCIDKLPREYLPWNFYQQEFFHETHRRSTKKNKHHQDRNEKESVSPEKKE